MSQSTTDGLSRVPLGYVQFSRPQRRRFTLDPVAVDAALSLEAALRNDQDLFDLPDHGPISLRVGPRAGALRYQDPIRPSATTGRHQAAAALGCSRPGP